MLAPGLNEGLKEDGLWWIEGDEEKKVAGTLTYDGSAGAVLQLIGMLRNIAMPLQAAFGSDDGEMLTIHGLTKKGRPVTLLRAFVTNRQMNMPGIAHERWFANALIIGWHITSSDQQIFSKSYVRFQDIEKWLEHKPFEDNFDRNSQTMTLTATRQKEELFAKIHDFNVTTVGSLHYNNDSPTYFKVEVFSQIGIVPEKPQSLDWQFSRASRIQELASLCAGYHLPLLSVELQGPDERFGGELSRPSVGHVYRLMQHPEGDKWRKHDAPIISGPELLNFNPNAIQEWFDQHELLGPAIRLFFTITGQKIMFTNVRFLLAIQALEVFHRRTSDATVMSESDFLQFLDQLSSRIPENASAAMKARLEGSYKFINELSLGQRLKALMNLIHTEFEFKPPAFNKRFLKKLVDTRNYYTHFSKELAESKLDGEGMHWANRRMILLLTVLFIMRLGVSAKDIANLLKRHREFSQLWENEGSPV